MISLKQKILSQIAGNKPFICFREPGNTHVSFLESHTFVLKQINLEDISDYMEGFLLFPFHKNKKGYFFNVKNSEESKTIFEIPDSGNTSIVSKNEYSELLSKAIRLMKNSELQKVVLSRIKKQQKIPNEKIPELFIQLTKNYPFAFNYLIQLPSGQKWMGATPETLLSISGNIVKTMALAGTKVYDAKNNSMDIWRDKEIKEQYIVQEYIKEKLQFIGYKDLTISPTFNKRAGNLVHLCTEFEFKLNSNIAKILKALHPTPAVCGTPFNSALQFIQQNETHNREFYTGFLGKISPNSTRLFVNLRCLKIDKEDTYIYIGGGITKDSDILEEWNETENKSKTLISVINQVI